MPALPVSVVVLIEQNLILVNLRLDDSPKTNNTDVDGSGDVDYTQDPDIDIVDMTTYISSPKATSSTISSTTRSIWGQLTTRSTTIAAKTTSSEPTSSVTDDEADDYDTSDTTTEGITGDDSKEGKRVFDESFINDTI